jgi:hypothetical protein
VRVQEVAIEFGSITGASDVIIKLTNAGEDDRAFCKLLE